MYSFEEENVIVKYVKKQAEFEFPTTEWDLRLIMFTFSYTVSKVRTLLIFSPFFSIKKLKFNFSLHFVVLFH
jgi:hypothetical protein